MVWPTDDLTKIHLDSNLATDDPSQAKAELEAHIDKTKEMLAEEVIVGFENESITSLAGLSGNGTFSNFDIGTFSPELWDASNNGSEGQVYSNRSGVYTRIGNMVFVSISMTMSSLGSLSNSSESRIGNLPFQPSNNGLDSLHSGFSSGLNMGVNGGQLTGLAMSANGGYIALHLWVGQTGSQLFRTFNLSPTSSIRLSGHYSV